MVYSDCFGLLSVYRNVLGASVALVQLYLAASVRLSTREVYS